MSHLFHTARVARSFIAAAAFTAAAITTTAVSAAHFADHVVSYDPGNATFYTNSSAAVGAPNGIVGASMGFDAVLSPFNPAWEDHDLVRIGEGGHLTLALSHYALPTAGLELGVFVNVGLMDASYPSGTATNPASTFNTIEDSVVVEVSDDGVNFVALSAGSPILMDLPTNYYNNAGPFDTAAPASPDYADFGKPFDAALADFSGLNWAGILALLDGSAGGNWLDISTTGLDKVGFVRFSVLDDGNPDTNFDFELLALSIAHEAVGAPIPEPASAMLMAACGGVLILRRRSRNHTHN